MKHQNVSIAILLIFCLTGCSNQKKNSLIGKWQVLTVVENGQSIDLNDNWIHFKNNGTFSSHDGESNKDESGNWSYSANENKLQIDSDLGEKNDSEWFIHTRNDTLIFSEKKFLNNQRLSLRAIRIK